MTRYVVTGGAGFIGSALVRALLARRRQPGARHRQSSDRPRIAISLKYRSQIEWDRSDIRDAGAMLSAIRGADIVFHLAAIPSVPRSIQDPVPSHEVNIDGTFNVLRACVDAKVRRVVYAASSSAYGDTEVLPKVETMLPRPKSPYAVQKLAGRALRQRVSFLLRTGNRRAAILQRLRRAAGSIQSLLGRAVAVLESPDRAPLAHHLRRRRTDPRFHLRRRRGGAVL